jgi:glutamate-5-semialdehyde dehydrogenase
MDCTPIFKALVTASRKNNLLDGKNISDVLLKIADAAEKNCNIILAENQKDLERMDKNDPKYDRLLLSHERLFEIAADIRNVAKLPSPLNRILEEKTRPNGLQIRKITVPFGVVGIIYEARPNVTFDVFALCFKSGNACVLKGGSDAIYSNTAIVQIIKEVLKESGIDENVIALLPVGREETAQLLNAHGYVDLIIPRGSQSLIDFVRENSKIPVIETGAGIVHIYFDESGDKEKGRAIINNSKTRRVSVCNALDCLIIHESRLKDLAHLVSLCRFSNVEIFADEKAYQVLEGNYSEELLKHSTEESYGIEYLSYKMSIKTVASIEEALEHIARYSSKHSESIISRNANHIKLFQKMVDAAVVYVNVSTAFTDGAQFGLGAEIGISTQKLHARGPMALAELTSYKWLVEGDGAIRG